MTLSTERNARPRPERKYTRTVFFRVIFAVLALLILTYIYPGDKPFSIGVARHLHGRSLEQSIEDEEVSTFLVSLSAQLPMPTVPIADVNVRICSVDLYMQRQTNARL
jgi:hypothetical protein